MSRRRPRTGRRTGPKGSLCSQAEEELGEFLDARLARELPPLLGAQVAVAQLARLPSRVQADQRLAAALLVLGGDDDPGPGLADELRSGAVRRNRREYRPLGGEVLEDL